MNCKTQFKFYTLRNAGKKNYVENSWMTLNNFVMLIERNTNNKKMRYYVYVLRWKKNNHSHHSNTNNSTTPPTLVLPSHIIIIIIGRKMAKHISYLYKFVQIWNFPTQNGSHQRMIRAHDQQKKKLQINFFNLSREVRRDWTQTLDKK